MATPADQRLCDTPMTNSFMQFAGFLVNCFNNPTLEDVLVCMNTEHIEIGGRFNPEAANTKIRPPEAEVNDVKTTNPLVLDVSTKSAQKSSSMRHNDLQILSNVTDVRPEDLNLDSTLDELGIDSLMATEALNDVRTTLDLTIDLTSFLFFPSIQALIAHVDENLGVGSESDDINTPPSRSTEPSIVDLSRPSN